METTDNKKIILTNRSAIAVGIFLIGTTFSATMFYSQTQYQKLVSTQNSENLKMLRQLVETKHLEEREYIKQEIGGLREDWDRDRLEQNKRFERIEDLDK